jgi:hypothetical protein
MGKSPEEGIKAPVKTSTTTQITLFGTGQTLNGVLTGTKDRVLVKDQVVDAENGTYNVGPDAWERTTDMNAADDLDNGMLIVDSNTNVLYSIVFSGVWSPGATPLNFVVLVGAMPASIVLTSNSPIDLVDHDVALVTGALDPSISQHLEYDFQAIQSKSDDTTAAPLFLNPLGSYTQGPQVIAGNPGLEQAGITIDGILYQSALKASDIGGTNVAAFIVHRHSTTLPAIIVGSRSNSDDNTHALVTDNDTLLAIMAVGWDGVDYKQGAQIRFQVDGVAAAGDMPGRITFLTAAAGTTVLVERMRISQDGEVQVNGDLLLSANPPRINLLSTGAALDQGYTRIAPNVYRIFDDALANFYEYFRTTRSGTGAGIQVDTIAFTAATSFTVDAPDLAVTGTVDGVDIDALSSAFVAHAIDGSIHFTQGAISIPASQISDFDVEVANNAAVTANTAKVTNVPTALSIGTVTGTTWAITSDGGADDVVIPIFTDADAGLVRGSGGGTANFLRADGTFTVPPGTSNNFTVVVETTTSRTAVAWEAVMADDDTAAGVITIDLPAGSTDAMIIVKKIGSSFDVIIDGDSGETIDGQLTFTLTAKYSSLTVLWNGTEWSIV